MCLDEGFYQRIPLYIVLSGENSTVDGEAIPIHLKIARRLIERGEHFMSLFIYLIVNPAFRITIKSIL